MTRANPIDRVLARCVREDRGHDTPCLIWQGAHLPKGYGLVKVSGSPVLVHHVIYGPVPDGHEVHHLCGQTACCQRSHLQAVTRPEHASKHARSDRSHCANGHPFDDANVYTYHGRRQCRTCRRHATARYRDRRAV